MLTHRHQTRCRAAARCAHRQRAAAWQRSAHAATARVARRDHVANHRMRARCGINIRRNGGRRKWRATAASRKGAYAYCLTVTAWRKISRKSNDGVFSWRHENVKMAAASVVTKAATKRNQQRKQRRIINK